MNNTAGTNGGAVMVSGNINLQDSIIMNNNGNETGGSFYIQQPMYDKKTVINIHNNLITNNTSPYGQEIFIKWWDAYNLYPQFDNNDWGDENPNDSSVIDPNNVTSRSKVSSTIKSDLFGKLNVDLLDKYRDLLEDYFADDSLDNLKKRFDDAKPKQNNNQNSNDNTQSDNENRQNTIEQNNTNDNLNINSQTESSQITNTNYDSQLVIGNSTTAGNEKNAYEINKTHPAVKEINMDLRYFAAALIIVFILLAIGYKRHENEE